MATAQPGKQFWPPGVFALLYIVLCVSIPCSTIYSVNFVLQSTMNSVQPFCPSIHWIALPIHSLLQNKTQQHRSLQGVSDLLIMTLTWTPHHCQKIISTIWVNMSKVFITAIVFHYCNSYVWHCKPIPLDRYCKRGIVCVFYWLVLVRQVFLLSAILFGFQQRWSVWSKQKPVDHHPPPCPHLSIQKKKGNRKGRQNRNKPSSSNSL